jgi:hypothetical protein
MGVCGHPQCPQSSCQTMLNSASVLPYHSVSYTATICLSPGPYCHACSQHNRSPLEWRVPLVGGRYFWFSHNAFLAHAAGIAVMDYVVYSLDEGHWTKAQIYAGEYCAPGAFLIYRPFYTADKECPGISFLVQELHQRMMITLPETPPLQIPHCYMHAPGSDFGCQDSSSLVPDSDSNSG